MRVQTPVRFHVKRTPNSETIIFDDDIEVASGETISLTYNRDDNGDVVEVMMEQQVPPFEVTA